MWTYGRKIIDSLFKRRAKRHPICAQLESRGEADSDRSDIGVFEVGLSPQRHGNYEQGKGNSAQEAESDRLIAIAKAHGLFIPREEGDSFGDRKRLPSGESIVFFDEKGQKVIKVRNPFAKSAIKQMHSQDAIYEHLVHNVLFTNTRYLFMGISEDVDGVRIILSQPYISKKFMPCSQEEIDRYLMEGLGLKPENRYFYGNDYIAVTDVSSEGDNVLTDGTQLYFIDPIIMMKKPAIEVLNYYYEQLK